MIYFIAQNRNLVGFELVLSNVPSALGKVSSLIASYGLNIEYLETRFLSEGEYGLFIIVDFTKSRIEPQDLLNKLRGIREYVLSVSLAPTIRDIIYPPRFCIIDLGGIRAILLSVANIEGIIKGLRERLGDNINNIFLFQLGYSVGKKTYELYAKMRNIKDINDGIKLFMALIRGAGWGEIIDYTIEDNKLILKIDRLWECEIQKREVDRPASHYVRGIITGFFREITRLGLEVRERKCIALGDPYCEFEILFKQGNKST